MREVMETRKKFLLVILLLSTLFNYGHFCNLIIREHDEYQPPMIRALVYRAGKLISNSTFMDGFRIVHYVDDTDYEDYDSEEPTNLSVNSDIIASPHDSLEGDESLPEIDSASREMGADEGNYGQHIESPIFPKLDQLRIIVDDYHFEYNIDEDEGLNIKDST